MATTPIEIPYRTGKTLTVDMFPEDSDTATFTGRSLTEETNRKGIYKCDVTENTGSTYYHTLHVYEGTALRAVYDIYLTDSALTWRAREFGINRIDGLNVTQNTSLVIIDSNVDDVKTKTDQMVFTTANQLDATAVTVSDKTGYSISGTITTLDALDAAQDAQHSTTQGKIDTAQADLDKVTGADGATLATLQENYSPSKAGDSMNVETINGATVTGDGTSGDKWRGV